MVVPSAIVVLVTLGRRAVRGEHPSGWGAGTNVSTPQPHLGSDSHSRLSADGQAVYDTVIVGVMTPPCASLPSEGAVLLPAAAVAPTVVTAPQAVCTVPA